MYTVLLLSGSSHYCIQGGDTACRAVEPKGAPVSEEGKDECLTDIEAVFLSQKELVSLRYK